MPKLSQEEVSAAAQYVRERIQRLALITQENPVDLTNRLARWKVTTIDGLREHGALDAAKTLQSEHAQRYMTMYESQQPNYDYLDARVYNEFLAGVARDLEQEPESVLRGGQSVGQPVKVTREGVFVSGQQFDALLLISGLVTSAKTKIDIIDNWLGESFLQLLAGKAPNVQVAILTAEVKPPVLALARAFQTQHGGLAIRTTKAFHDRFLIIDDKDHYHFGASFKDLGGRGFMFSRIEEDAVVKALKKEWTRA